MLSTPYGTGPLTTDSVALGLPIKAKISLNNWTILLGLEANEVQNKAIMVIKVNSACHLLIIIVYRKWDERLIAATTCLIRNYEETRWSFGPWLNPYLIKLSDNSFRCKFQRLWAILKVFKEPQCRLQRSDPVISSCRGVVSLRKLMLNHPPFSREKPDVSKY